MALNIFLRKKESAATGIATCDAPVWQTVKPPDVFEPAEALVLERDALKQHLQLERLGRIVRNRRQWRDRPGFDEIVGRACSAIDKSFALVPEGFVTMPQTIHDFPGCPEAVAETEPFLLAFHTVTNAQYQKFVDADGYQQLDLFPEDIWPHLIDFKDQADVPGPRFWRKGRHDKNKADHPVVGICYHEAAAFAEWAGYRLPTEAEWQMAASWRIRSSADVLRRYPWGDAMDTKKCNIWASRIGKTLPVGDLEAGAAPNGVRQLVGNVWEWTASDYNVTDENGRPVVGGMLMKGVRGGAYDTYFASQTTSCFRTGLACLSRSHNVGFRCALDESATA